MPVRERARRSLKAVSAAADRIRRPRQGIVILIYHRVGSPTGGEMSITPAEFRRQLGWLAATQRLLTLDAAVAELAATPAVQRPGVVLTFDDGTPDWVEHVLPALTEHGVPATFYVATMFTEDLVAYPDGSPPISWEGLKELQASDLVTLGSHTHRHTLLDRSPLEVVRDELDRSIDLLGERLGVHPPHFAYPKAVAPSPAAAAEVASRFDSAVLAGTRANLPGTDPYRLARSPIQASDRPSDVEGKVGGGRWFEDAVRVAANRVRYRGATS